MKMGELLLSYTNPHLEYSEGRKRTLADEYCDRFLYISYSGENTFGGFETV